MTRVLCLLAALVSAATPAAVSAQPGAAGQPPSEIAPRTMRLTVDEAVVLALENNLGVQMARLGPRMEDLALAQIRANRTPTLNTTLGTTSRNSPNQDFLSGGQAVRTTTEVLTNSVSLQQQTLPWGGAYSVGWNSSRTTTNNAFSTFSPAISSSMSLSYSQSVTRGFIDSTRQQLETGMKTRDIADLQLRETLANMTRRVRNAYWDLAYAIASLEVQRQSFELAQESLRSTRARVDAGVLPPIDIVGAEAEVALREGGIINAEEAIASAEDALRLLVFDPDMIDFWTVRIEPSAELPRFQPVAVDVDAAMRNAQARRTDLHRTRLELERDELGLRFLRAQARPDVAANVNYQVSALGGTQLQRGVGPFGPGTGDIVGQEQRSYATVLGDLFRSQNPTWTVGVSVSYPLGTSAQQASLTQRRLQHSQAQTQARTQELTVAMQVRELGRQVQTSARRVEALRTSRERLELRLEAEQRKLDAGTATNFDVFQAQRDLAEARNNELRAILDYNRFIVDFETAQEVPLR
jgi:outer membrane protein